eukprot:scaffold36404_cov49-Attheya_sp.AAC.3
MRSTAKYFQTNYKQRMAWCSDRKEGRTPNAHKTPALGMSKPKTKWGDFILSHHNPELFFLV